MFLLFALFCIEKHMNDQNIGECFVVNHHFPSNTHSFEYFYQQNLFFLDRYSPLSPADFFAATYLPAAAAAATTLTQSTGKFISILFKTRKFLFFFLQIFHRLVGVYLFII